MEVEALIECVLMFMKILIKYYKYGGMDKVAFLINMKFKIKFLEENIVRLQSFEKRIEAEKLIEEYYNIC